MEFAKPVQVRHIAAANDSNFWDRASKPSDDACWEWGQAQNDKGYGRVVLLGSELKAHRVAYALGNGVEVPGSVLVCHHCDNPSCVNPRHLFLGSFQDNNIDTWNKGRGKRLLEAANGNNWLSDEAVAWVRETVGVVKGADAARTLGCSPALISMIRSGKRRQKA